MGDIPLVPYHAQMTELPAICESAGGPASAFYWPIMAGRAGRICRKAANNNEELEGETAVDFILGERLIRYFNHRRNCAVKEITRCRTLPPICR